MLKSEGRNTEAYKEAIKAGEIVKKERAINQEKEAAIKKRWEFKLCLGPDYEPPFPLERYHPADPRLDKALREADLQGYPLADVKTYYEKVSPFNLAAFSRDVYLDRCIEELILECEAGRQEQKSAIEKLEKHVEKLEEVADLAEQYGEEGPPEDREGDD